MRLSALLLSFLYFQLFRYLLIFQPLPITIKQKAYISIVGKEGELTFVDSEGEAKTIDMPVNSVIPLNSDAAEAIRVVGAAHKIVAIDSSISKKTSFFPEISALPTIGRGFNPDIEEILVISPDIVVAYAPGIYNPGHEDLEDKLEPAVKVVRLDLFNRGADKLREEIMILGYILGEVENAKKYVDWYDKYVGAVKDRVSTIPEGDRVKVFIDWCSAGQTSRHTIARGGLGFLCEEAGGMNIAAEFEVPYPDVELEWVIRENPDVIVGYAHGRWFKGESGYETDDESGVRAFLEEIKGLPGFESVSAVKNGRIYIISAEIVTSTAYPVGISYMAKWFYPELFEDLNPEGIHQEYMDDFCGIDYDVSEHGVFVYWEE